MTSKLFCALLLAFTLSSGAMAQSIVRMAPDDQATVQLSYAPIVRSAAPAVVNVYATTITQQNVSPFANDPFFKRFFGGRDPFSQTRPRESQSLGSGVIIGADGLILTNSHVVSKSKDIRITLTTGREYDVDLVLDDPKTDLAVLRIQKPDRAFPALEFGDSDGLEVGDLVLAIGNPFGVGQTVTSGIVSALARTGIETSDYGFFIQTDAAINPGNSGGALVDMQGKLVGVNSAIFTRSGGSLGIGFAIPANMARIVAEAGRVGGEIVRPWLGVALQDVTSDLADSLGLDVPHGALVTEIAPDSPASAAGLVSGDVILSVDGVEIENVGAFSFRLATKPARGTVKIGFARNRTLTEIEVMLAPAPEPAAGDTRATIGGETRFAGVTAAELTPQSAEALGLAFSSKGVVIEKVEPNSPAARVGFRAGDIIVALNGVEVLDIETFRDLAVTRPQRWQIVLRRDGRIIRSIVSG